MNERLLNLITNPYTWVILVFIMALPYLLNYMRRFYPEKLRKQMEKEEACTLELQQKLEMKRMRKYITIGFIFSALLTVCIAYYFEIERGNISWIFIISMTPITFYAMIVEHRISKGKKCLQFYDKKEFFILVGIFVVVTSIIVTIILKIFAK